VRQDREDGFAPRALDTPDGETTQANTGVMRVACQVPVAATGGLVGELKAQGQEKGEHAFDKCLPIAKELKVGRFIVEIDGDGPIFTGLVDSVSHGHPQIRWSLSWVTKDEDKASQFQEGRGGGGTLPLKSVECGFFDWGSQTPQTP
jgi:hypothetical protein